MSSNNDHIWVIDDDRSIRWVSFKSASGIMDRLSTEQPDAIIADIRMPGMDGLALMELIQTSYPDLPVIIMTAHSDLDSAIAASSRSTASGS